MGAWNSDPVGISAGQTHGLTDPASPTPPSPIGRMKTDSKDHSVSDLKKDSARLEAVKRKLSEGKYVAPGILREVGLDTNVYSGKNAQNRAMEKGESCFAQAKSANQENLRDIRPAKEKQPFPKSSLTRMLTGDVKPEWLVGLGRMQADKVTPADGYKDVFVSSLEEYERKGIHFDRNIANDPANMAEKLDLKGADLEKIQNHGAWLLQIHPGSNLAIPTKRESEWNPGYVEGGYTGSNQQEWVTPNIGLDENARAGLVKIYKMDTQGKTVEWKFFKGKLMPVDEWQKAIQKHVDTIAQRHMPKITVALPANG